LSLPGLLLYVGIPLFWIGDDMPDNPVKVGFIAHDMFVKTALPEVCAARATRFADRDGRGWFEL